MKINTDFTKDKYWNLKDSNGDEIEYTEIVVNSDYVEKDEEGYLTIINLEVA